MVIHKLVGEELKPKHALLLVALSIRVIYSILNGNKGLVIDPYCGSGSSLVAAKLLGCDYIGIEISPEYVRMAEERLNSCENERTKIELEIQKHRVVKTFKQRKEEGYWSKTPKEKEMNAERQLSLIREKSKHIYRVKQKRKS
ncbi:MAG: DNA methyltransferase [Candidatus Edwardsbacteria bacterium]